MLLHRPRFDPLEALAGRRPELGPHGGVTPAIEPSTAFAVGEADALADVFQGRLGPADGCYLYGRHQNPTVAELGRRLAALEDAEAAACTASGMGAIASTLLQLTAAGDHVVASRAVYGGTFALLDAYLPEKAGLRVTFVDATDLDAVDAALTDETRVLYVEALSNPTLRVADVPRLAELAHARGAKLVVDNTFSPLVLSPLRLGADVVVHSLTKFVNGASDLLAGAVCGPAELIEELADLRRGSLMLLGPTLDARAAHAITLRLPHLGLRMAEHGRRARAFAEGLSELGLPVVYPGLPDHPDHALLERLANPGYGAGGVLGVDLGSAAEADRFCELLQNEQGFGLMAVSLGFFETLLTRPAGSTSSELDDAALERAGIPPGLVRISVGYTGSLEQRRRQLLRALGRLGRLPARAG